MAAQDSTDKLHQRGPALSRRALLAGGTAAVAAAAGGCARPPARATSGERRLTVWHAWGGVMGPRFEKIAAAFERAHPGIRLRLVYTQNNLSTNQKFLGMTTSGIKG